MRSLGVLMSIAMALQGMFGCNGASSDATQTAGSGRPPAATSCKSLPVEQCECGALSLDACVTDTRCAVITGAPYDEARSCLGARSVVGCGTAGASTMGTCARDPSGVTWLFGDLRIPSGWTPVPSCPPYPQRACSTPSAN